MRNGFFGQIWPLKIEIFLLEWTICWETDKSFLNTLCISGINLLNLKYPHNVKIISMLVNQPVTNNGLFKQINLVGTSETIRPLSSMPS